MLHKHTSDIEVGSRIDLPGSRGVIVTSNEPDGLGVMWYAPDGTGPFHAVLPHGKVQAVAYHDGCYIGGGGGYGMWNQDIVEFERGVQDTVKQTGGGRGWFGTVQAGCVPGLQRPR